MPRRLRLAIAYFAGGMLITVLTAWISAAQPWPSTSEHFAEREGDPWPPAAPTDWPDRPQHIIISQFAWTVDRFVNETNNGHSPYEYFTVDICRYGYPCRALALELWGHDVPPEIENPIGSDPDYSWYRRGIQLP